MTKFRDFLNEATPKIGCVIAARKTGRTRYIGTVDELTTAFSYTLKVGASYSKEKGNVKINEKPKTVKALVKELEKSLNNSGNQGSYEYDDCTKEEIEKYKENGQFETDL